MHSEAGAGPTAAVLLGPLPCCVSVPDLPLTQPAGVVGRAPGQHMSIYSSETGLNARVEGIPLQASLQTSPQRPRQIAQMLKMRSRSNQIEKAAAALLRQTYAAPTT